MFQKSSLSLVAIRRLLVKHPWVYWVCVALVAAAIAVSVLQRADRVDAERASWGDTVVALVAVGDHAPGEPLQVTPVDFPQALVPPGAIDESANLTARQHITAGEVVTRPDVVATTGVKSLIPKDWLAVPIVEAPSVGAAVGDHVVMAADGFVVARQALVVGGAGDVTLVAVPADDAPVVAAAAAERAVTLLLAP